jgi:hypothetical protein
MFARALIVLLLVLNLGVAMWWALRPATEPPPMAGVPTGAPRLLLLREAPEPPRALTFAASPAIVPAVAPETGTMTAMARRCVAFGPFTDAMTLAQASAILQLQVVRLHVREAPTSGHGWRVWLPPLADHAAAQAMAARIAAAGFKDYYIVPGGDQGNSIALGRYGNAEAAQHRQSSLQAAGFPAQSEALGGAAHWIDVVATTTFDADIARSRIGAPYARPLDCARLALGTP